MLSIVCRNSGCTQAHNHANNSDYYFYEFILSIAINAFEIRKYIKNQYQKVYIENQTPI